jgi:hypothetical protein
MSNCPPITGPFKLTDWNCLLDAVNTALNGCPGVPVFQHVADPYIWTTKDLTAVQNAISQSCSGAFTSPPNPATWLQKYIDEINAALPNCKCKSGYCASVYSSLVNPPAQTPNVPLQAASKAALTTLIDNYTAGMVAKYGNRFASSTTTFCSCNQAPCNGGGSGPTGPTGPPAVYCVYTNITITPQSGFPVIAMQSFAANSLSDAQSATSAWEASETAYWSTQRCTVSFSTYYSGQC